MEKIIVGLKYLSFALGVTSLVFIIYSFAFLLRYDSSISLVASVDKIYKALSTYSGLYKLTFITCAFWATLRQIEISQSNYDNTLMQVKFVQDDILDKRKRDITNDTLVQCNLYFQELQISFKELIETDVVSGAPIDWKLLQHFTSTSLQKKYPYMFERFQSIDRKTKNQVLITLYKLEAFSSLFIHGNLDGQLAKGIIGYTYTKQVGFLLGLISFFRADSEDIFGKNTVELYKKWKVDEEKS